MKGLKEDEEKGGSFNGFCVELSGQVSRWEKSAKREKKIKEVAASTNHGYELNCTTVYYILPQSQ